MSKGILLLMFWHGSIHSVLAIKPMLATIVLVVLWALESVVPMYVGRKHRVRHDLTNLALGLLNTLAVAVPFASVMLLTTQWAQDGEVGLVYWLPGPVWFPWVVALILFDAWMYVWHRLNHRVHFLWRFHAVHHSDRQIDASSAFRFHTAEIALSFVARLMVLPLLGMTMPQLLVYETILLPVILFHHSNVRWPARIDGVLRWLIVTPRMHWVHHSKNQPETDSNFASVLSIWDRCFGSFRLRDKPEQIDFGLHDTEGGALWRTLPEMLNAPFASNQNKDASNP